MTVTSDVKKTGNTITGRFTLKNLPTFDAAQAKKPLFAYVGVADLAIERAKEIPADLSVATTNVTKKAQALLADVPAQVTALPVTVRTNVEKATVKARTNVEKATVKARTNVEKATEKATATYTKLTTRGERLVKAIRRQPATEAAIAEGKAAVRKAEAASTAAKKSVKAGEQAVEDAAAKIG
jgi:F0F1-type ATP synthase membrane subunit b/b'